MPTAFVTGATGFVGLNLVERLTDEGWEVTALHRPSSNLSLLKRFAPKLAVGDVTDREAVRAGIPEGVDVVFHTAANVTFWPPHYGLQTRINVDGTRNLIEAALSRQAKRFVHCSSVAAYGPADGDVLREDRPSRALGHSNNYFESKWLAEEEVRRGIAKGLDAVMVNPGNILGPYELHNWSRVFVLVKQNKLPGVLPGAAPWCHVKSVVDAHLAAAERGKTGENYLIGAVHASYLELIQLIAELTGGRRPKRVTPPLLLHAFGHLSYWVSLLTRKEPDVTPEIVRMTNMSYSCDCGKAQRELGYQEVALREMAADTYEWMVAEGRL